MPKKDKTPNGRNDFAYDEWAMNGFQDGRQNRSTDGSVPAAFQATYNEAYQYGKYVRTYTEKITI